MATKVLLSSNGSQGSSSKGRRLERRARRERCRTQVYEGQEQRPPLEEAAASSDQSQRSLRPRHKSCDSKVDLKSKRRSYPEQQQTDTESDSPAENSRRMARRPRRSRGDNSSRTNESGHSSGNQPNRNSVSSQKNLNVPVNPLTCQPSSDSALYSSQRAPQGNVSSNGSRSKFQQLEQRRRQRLDMTVTSDEEAVDYPGTPPSSTKMKTQKTYANGKPQDVSSQQPQFGFTHNYNPASFNNETQQSYLVGHVPTFPRESQLDNSEELMTKKPVSQLKAQFENQMQQSSSTQSPNKVANVSSSGPVSRTFNPNSVEPKRLSSGAVNALDPVPVKGSRWQTSGQTQPPAVSIKPLKSQPVHLSRPVGQLYQPLSDEQSTVSKNRSYNDADSLDELLESNKDYLGQALGNSDEKAAVKANIKQTMKTLQSQSASVKPNTEPGAVFSRRRTSDPTLRREAVPQTFVRNGRQSFATNTSEMFTAKITASPSGSTSIQGPQTLAKPVWPRNILSSLSPEIACQAATNNEPVQSALSPVVSPPAATPQHKQSSSARPSLRSPSSDTLEDLWIPRRSEPEHSQSAPKNHGDGRQARRSETKNGSTSTRVDKDLAVSSPPKKPERTFVYNTPVMVVTEDKSQPHANALVTSSIPNENVCSPDGLSVPLGADGMFSDVDYNIEVSERVKKWEFLMHEKNMPARKDQTPDKVNLFELDEMGVLLSPRSRLSVIDEKSEAKNVFGFPSASPVGKTGSGVVTNSGGDLMLSENQMWTYPGSSQTKPSPPKATTGPQESVRQHRDIAFGGEAWYSDWYFKGYAKDIKSPATEHKHLKDSKPTELSPAPSQKMRNAASSYGSSPTMTRKIVYEPVKPDSEQPRLNPFFAPSSDSEITNPLYTPVKVRLEPVISTKKSVPLKSSQSGHLSASAVHRRQDSDEQIWKEIERMTLYARAIAGAASSASESRSEAVPSHQVQKSPTRRSAYEPLISENASADLFVPLSVDVSSPKRNQRSRLSNPLDNVPLVASAKTYKPKNPAKITTRSFQYHHIPVTDKYQRPEALDDVLEEIASSRERKPFSPKNKSPGLSSSSQWSTGTPDKPPLSPDIISMTSNQQMYRGNDPTGGRPSSMAFPAKNSSYYPQQTTDSNKRETERKYAEKQTRFMNLAHGKEYQLDHNLLKQKLLGTGLVEESPLSPTYIAAPRFRESQLADSGSGKAVDSDSGSQHSMTHVNNAIKELRHLAQDVESRINMIKTRLVTTKEEDLDTVLMTLRRCSSNLASAKSGHVGSSASAKSRKTKLNDALSELEKIYESLDLNSDPSANTKREYPPSQGSQWSITSMTDISSLGSYTHSGSEVHTDANLSDYNMRWQSSDFARREKKRKLYSNDGLDQLTRALESSGYSNSSSDPWQSVRRDQDGEETPRALNIFNFTTTAPASHDNLPNQRFQVQVETKPITADHYYTPTESLSALSSEESNRRTRSRKQDVDLTDDGSYRKIRTKSATRGDTDSPNVSASSTDYLSQHCRPQARSRQQTHPEKETVQYHNSYTNSRYDGIIDNPKPPPRSSSLHRKGQRNRTDESDSDPQHLCNAETQTCHLDEGDSSGAENRGLGHKRQGRSKEKSQSSRKLSKEKRRRSFGRGVAKMVERFSSSEDERPRRRLQHSRSAPDLTETHYSDTYNSKGEIISTETDTNKEDEAPLQNGKKKSKDNKAMANNKSSTKSQTPRTVKQRNEAKSRIRNNLQNTTDSKTTKQSRIVNGNSKIQNKTVLKAKAMENFVSSSDQTPLGSSCEGSPASARLLIHRQTKRVPLATISTTSTSGEESASGSKTSLNQTMALPQGSVVRRQTPADLPSGSGVKLRKTKPSVTKAERKERSKSVPELCARFETDPTRLKSILGSLRKSISAGSGTIESFEKAKKLPFCSEPNLRDNRISGRVINKETLLLNWDLKEDTEKEIFC